MVGLLLSLPLWPVLARNNGPVCDTYTYKKTTDNGGLGANIVNGVYAVCTTVYAATQDGLFFYMAAPMPVSLISFTATVQPSRRVALTWATSLEMGNRGFLIERSKDLRVIEIVGEVSEIVPNSSARQEYQLIDQTPYLDTSYYRLTQIDLSGKTTVYPAVTVVLSDEAYGVYPNPVAGDGRFKHGLDEPQTAVVGFYHADGWSFPLLKTGVEAGKLHLKITDNLLEVFI